jgi:hypothetical protein
VNIPIPKYDPIFIQETLEAQPPDILSEFNPPRTNTYLQFYSSMPEHFSEKPYVSKVPPNKKDVPQINFQGEYHKVMITDISGHEEKFTLDDAGFEVVLNAYNVQVNGINHINEYIQEMSTWLERHLKCQEVFVFDYALRHEQSKTVGGTGYVDVARRVHCGLFSRYSIYVKILAG